MDIGIVYDPKEPDFRVPLSPGAVSSLTRHNHRVYLLKGAGAASNFADEDYGARGATIVYSSDEVYQRAKLLLKVTAPPIQDISLLNRGSILIAFLHLAVASESYIDELLKNEITAIGFEVIARENGELPLLASTSEVAGQLSIQIAAQYLQSNLGGRGILLGGTPGIPPANVLILGAGSVGRSAAQVAAALGANVLVLDRDIAKLRLVEQQLGKRIATGFASIHGLTEWIKTADVFIGAIYVPGGKTPLMVSEEMVASMRKGSVIIDISIDQGGCVATSRPTTLINPIYDYKGVIHYCVPNLTSLVANSASFVISHVLLPYILEIGEWGDDFLRHMPDLARGTYTHRGKIISPVLGRLLGREYSLVEGI